MSTTVVHLLIVFCVLLAALPGRFAPHHGAAHASAGTPNSRPIGRASFPAPRRDNISSTRVRVGAGPRHWKVAMTAAQRGPESDREYWAFVIVTPASMVIWSSYWFFWNLWRPPRFKGFARGEWRGIRFIWAQGKLLGGVIAPK